MEKNLVFSFHCLNVSEVNKGYDFVGSCGADSR